MAFDCPTKCGKRFISKEHAASHADTAHPDWMTPKQRGWATPFGFGDFTEPVTYEDACMKMKEIADTVWSKK